MSRMRQAVLGKSLQMKGQVCDQLSPVSIGGEHLVRHVDTSDRHGRCYRNEPSVFSISDDSDNSDDDIVAANDDNYEQSCDDGDDGSLPIAHKREKVELLQYLLQTDISSHFAGDQLSPKDSILQPCHLALTRTHLYIMHICSDNKQFAWIHQRRPLTNVQKITSKKRLPELLTLKYGYDIAPGQHRVTGVDRFLIPKAGDCAKAIKAAIFAFHEPVTVGLRIDQ